MASITSTDIRQRRTWLSQRERLTLPERIALLAFVVTMSGFDIVRMLTSVDKPHPDLFFSVAVTLVLAVYIWSPPIATAILGVVVGAAFISGYATGALLGLAMSALLVARVASPLLFVLYAGGLLVFTAVLASSSQVPGTDVSAYLVVATVSGSIGFSLRLLYLRGQNLETQLAERAEHERQAIISERQWIAGELHDSIAHHLTIVSLHSQMLDDDAMRPASQEAIRAAARKALTDLRFVINLADEGDINRGVASGDLAAAVEEARGEFEAAGHTTTMLGDPADEAISRGVDIILARVVREAATNIIKYAGPGEVRFALNIDTETISLSLTSPLSSKPPRVVSSTGTGLNRMAERVLGVRGEFSAGPQGEEWVVTAVLPVVSESGPGRDAALSPD